MCPVGSSRELGGELHALGLAARQGRCGLTESHVAQTHVDEGLDVAKDRRLAIEELEGLGDGHVQARRRWICRGT